MKEKVKKIVGRWQLWEMITLATLLIVIITLCSVFHCSVFVFITSILGVINVFLCAKGVLLYPMLQIISATFYAFVSYMNTYYGEAIINIGLMVPLSLFAIFTWFKNQNKEKDTVIVNHIRWKEWVVIGVAAAAIAVGFYFLLEAFQTPNLWLSTASVVFCAIANYLNLRRNKMLFIFFTLMNLVIVTMWILLIIQNHDLALIPIVVCNVVNIVLNLFGFVNWIKMEKTQADLTNKANLNK